MNFKKWLNILIVSACCAIGTAGAQVQTSLLDPWVPTIAEDFSGQIIWEGDLGFAFPKSGRDAYYTVDGGSSWQSVLIPLREGVAASSQPSNDSWLRAFVWNGEVFLYDWLFIRSKGYYSIRKLDAVRAEWVDVKQLDPSISNLPENVQRTLTIFPFESSWMAIEAFQEYLVDRRWIYQAASPSDWTWVGTTSYQSSQSGPISSHLQRHIYQDFYPFSVSEQNGIVWGTGFDPDVWDPSGSKPPPFPPLLYPMSTAWTRDGIHWGPIPLSEADETTDLNATDWPVGLLIKGVPGVSSWMYFDENRKRLTSNRISSPQLLKGESVMISSWVSRTQSWSVFELVDGEFIELASGSKYPPQARLGGIWIAGNRASYDLVDWVELPANADDLIIRDDRFLDTRTGYTSTELTPWPLAHRRDIEWVEDRYFGWVHDKYYPWVYIYTFGEGLEDGWFYIGWRWDNQAYVWSELRQEWVWVERESWPRAWSFTTEDWIGGAP